MVDAYSKASIAQPDHVKDRFIEILRGLSIFLVAYYHYVDRIPPDALNASHGPALPFYSGKIGVYIFFAISGYLIAKSIEQSKNLAEFYAKRISRIWPLFIAACVIIFLFLQAFPPPVVPEGPKQFYESPPNWKDLIGSIFFLYDFGFKWVDGAFWSILVELKFYVMAGAFAAIFKKNFIYIFSVFAAVVSMLDFALALFAPDLAGGAANKVLHGLLVSQYLPLFSLGMSFYARQLDSLLIANLFMASVQVISAASSSPDFEMAGTLRYLFAFALVLFVDFSLMNSRIMLFLGKYSYAIYLFHQMIGLTIISRFAHQLGYEGAMIIAVATVLTISVVTSWMFEWRFRRPVARGLIALMSLARLTRIDVSHRTDERPVASTAS